MFRTRVTDMLGIKYPIIGGTMMWITTPEFVAAVSNAGGLGILASAIYQTPDEFAAAVDRTTQLTDKPFAVNINLFPSMRPIDNSEYVDVLVQKVMQACERAAVGSVVISGGVACNKALRQRLKEEASPRGIGVYHPRPSYCTDNGAMIALAGYYRIIDGERTDMAMDVRSRFPVEGLPPMQRQEFI